MMNYQSPWELDAARPWSSTVVRRVVGNSTGREDAIAAVQSPVVSIPVRRARRCWRGPLRLDSNERRGGEGRVDIATQIILFALAVASTWRYVDEP
ncbi:MAG: hypothetical protein ACI9W2_001124 [Gammaproteobacteria bacterium]|jgi:hypothetical protein